MRNSWLSQGLLERVIRLWVSARKRPIIYMCVHFFFPSRQWKAVTCCLQLNTCSTTHCYTPETPSGLLGANVIFFSLTHIHVELLSLNKLLLLFQINGFTLKKNEATKNIDLVRVSKDAVKRTENNGRRVTALIVRKFIRRRRKRKKIRGHLCTKAE